MPIKTAGIVIGYIGIDNPARDRIELAVSLLRGISGHIGGLRENLAMMKKLEKNQLSLQQSLQELNAERDILDALSVDYTSVYYCDMMADTLIPIKCDDYNNAAAAVKEFAVKGGSYSFSMCRYYEQFVIKESAPDFLEKLNANYLREYLTNNKRFAYRYRVHPNKAGQQYFEVQIVKLPKSDGFKAVMGYRYVDDLVAKQEMQQTQLESALAAATLNSEIVGAISKLYWLIYRIDLVEKTYEEISATQETHILTGEKGYVADNEYEHLGKENAVESLSGISVLLVEDNELNMEIAQFILENARMKVTTAFNGKEAVDTFAASAPQQFDLILMDVMMPIMDGLTATQTIRAMKREDAQRIPIFAMTANAFVDDIASCRKAGMNEHLAKPLDQAKLLNTIRDYISRK